MSNYDIGIIGSGVAGTFALIKLAEKHKDAKIILFESGRAPAKRRAQMNGFLGLLPNGDGKYYLNDLNTTKELTTPKKTKAALKWFKEYTAPVFDFNIVQDKHLSATLQNKIKNYGFNLSYNNYVQLYPQNIHSFSRYIVNYLESNNNITFSFDNEVYRIAKQNKSFLISTQNGDFTCKKLLLCVGRSGWRWAKSIFDSFGLVENNDISKFGVRIEIAAPYMKEFNKSNCTIDNDDLKIGPLCWYGTIIPEDHIDMAIAAFRSNENRWKTDKVSFNVIGNRLFPGKGFEQTDRLGKLTWLLTDDRVVKEKISTLLHNKSRISVLPEYDWLAESLGKVGAFIPNLLSKGYLHIPMVIPEIPKIKLTSNLETEIKGLYCAGESAGIHGLLSASLTGIIAADAIGK